MEKQKQYRQYKPIGHCPVCGKGTVVEMTRSWSCDKWRDPVDTCKFTIWKTVCEVEIGEEVAKELVKNGVSPEKVDGLVSKRTGRKFSAWLVVDRDAGRVAFDFSKERPRLESQSAPAKNHDSKSSAMPSDGKEEDDPFADIPF